jgi:hypothetical protein
VKIFFVLPLTVVAGFRDQVAIIPYKYINDFDFNITKLKTVGQFLNSFMAFILLL